MTIAQDDPPAGMLEKIELPRDAVQQDPDKIYDLKSIVPASAALAFVCGWTYNIGFFSVLNFNFIDLLDVNDYVNSTLSALAPVLYFMSLSMLVGFIFSYDRALERGVSKIMPILERRSSDPVVAIFLIWNSLFWTISALSLLILNYYRDYRECEIIAIISWLGSMISALAAAKLFKRHYRNLKVLLYGFIASLPTSAGSVQGDDPLRRPAKGKF